MDEKFIKILDSYGLEVITDINDPRFIKDTKFNAKKLISEINGTAEIANFDSQEFQRPKKINKAKI